MAREYIQGKFIPKNPKKYIGRINEIYYRSSWELKFLEHADAHPAILSYSSEELVIPYISPIDNKTHRYFPDFVIKVKDKSGNVRNIVIEIKPSIQTKKPVRGKKRHKTFITEMLTWGVNEAKWHAAIQFCKKNNMEFLIMDEHALGIIT